MIPSGDTAQQRVPAGNQKRAKNNKKKVNSILQCDKKIRVFFFFFLIRPTCYVLYMEEEQSMINSTVQSSQVQSTAAVYTQPFLLIFNFTHTQFKIQ